LVKTVKTRTPAALHLALSGVLFLFAAPSLASAQSSADAAALDSLADTLAIASGPLPEIQSLADRSIAIKTKLLGPNDSSIAITLNILGLRKFRSGDYAASIADFTRARTIEDRPGSNAPPDLIATTLNGLGLAIGGKGDPRQALELHQRALVIREQIFGKEDWRTAEVLFSLSTDYRQSGDLAHSLEFSRRSVAMFERTNPGHPSAAMAIGALANVYRERGQLSEAKPLFEKAIAVFEKNFGPDSPRLIASYNNYGLCLKSMSDFPGARAALEQAVRVSTRANGPKSSITAQTLGNLGILYQQDGDYPRARQTYDSALAILDETLGPGHEGTASVLTSIGLVLRDMGDYRGAHPYIERALAIYKTRFGPENPKTLQVQGDLASLFIHEKDFHAARPLVESTLASYRRTVGPKSTLVAGQLAALAGILSATGEINPSIELYRQAVASYDASLGTLSYGAAEGRAELAEALLIAGKVAEAKQTANESVASFLKMFGPDYPNLAGVLAVQAEAELALGESGASFDHALESDRVRRFNLLAISRTSSERQALIYSAKNDDGLDVALRLAARGLPPAQGVRLWDALIRDRALVLDQMAERQRNARESSDPRLAALNRGLTLAREDLAKSVVAGPRAREPDYSGRVELLRSAVETQERQLSLHSSEFRTRLNRQRAGFDEVAGALPPASALAAYVRSSQGYLVFVLRAGEKSPAILFLGSNKQIDSAFQNWRAQIDRERQFQGREAAQNLLSYREAGATLRRVVWDPLAKLLPGVHDLYLTADGVLQLVNFAALPTGASRYLIESGPLLHILSAERDLRDHNPAPLTSGDMLAIGRPAFDARPALTTVSGDLFRGPRSHCQDFSSLDFADLPGSALEAQSVLKIWRAQGNSGTILTGERATESTFKEMASGKRIIHIATHGFFLGGGCASQMDLEDPLLRSGLALAGANRRASSGALQDDGILTAEEVASLDLGGAELVVLSGCDTGNGEIRSGEGVLGLRRAFQVAGARNLVMSLWPVTDEGARSWMTALYQARFSRGSSTAGAVRDASLGQLRSRRKSGQSTHPFYWAGFISVGES
jgi:CHAT domain-containing protein